MSAVQTLLQGRDNPIGLDFGLPCLTPAECLMATLSLRLQFISKGVFFTGGFVQLYALISLKACLFWGW